MWPGFKQLEFMVVLILFYFCEKFQTLQASIQSNGSPQGIFTQRSTCTLLLFYPISAALCAPLSSFCLLHLTLSPLCVPHTLDLYLLSHFLSRFMTRMCTCKNTQIYNFKSQFHMLGEVFSVLFLILSYFFPWDLHLYSFYSKCDFTFLFGSKYSINIIFVFSSLTHQLMDIQAASASSLS